MPLTKILFLAAYTGPEGKKMMWTGPNFGLYRMKFYLERKYPGMVIDVVDPSIIDPDFKKLDYDLIGFSPCHETLEHDLGLMYKAEKDAPRALIAAGGIHATFIHKWFLEESPADFVVLGEGEVPMENILKSYDPERGVESLSGIPGVSTRLAPPPTSPNLTPEEFSFCSRLMDFGRIPYLSHWKANSEQYKNPDLVAVQTVRLFTGNYCPWNCTFCSSTNFLDFSGRGDFDFSKTTKVVTLTAQELYDLLIKVAKSRPETKTVIFDDDNFVMSMTRLVDMCRLIIAGKERGEVPNDMTFVCQARIDNFRSSMAKSTLKLMKQCGFRMIMYGVESLSQPVLAEFYKNTPVPLIHEVLNDTMREGIRPLFYLILFSPGTSLQSVKETVIDALPYLDRECEVTLNFYVQDLPGTHYAKMDLERSYEELPIVVDGQEIKKIQKSTYLYPADPQVRAFARRILDQYPEYRQMFQERFGIDHIPGRVYTFIIFYAILEQLECHEEKQKLMAMFERHYAARV